MFEDSKFQMGAVVMTQGVGTLVENPRSLLHPLLARHARGDWGDLCQEDKMRNDVALIGGAILMSSYETLHGTIRIITEADRRSTTIRLPDEY